MMKRTLVIAMVVGAGVLACSSQPTVGDDEGRDDSADDLGRDGGFGNLDDVSFVSDDAERCEPATCSELGLDCGPVADGCGHILECGECEGEERCGIKTHNVCSPPSALCTRIPEAEACEDKECGIEGDGCGGMYDCGSCDADSACGIRVAFQCSTIPVDNPDECPAEIESCAAANAECGQTGNGCGGLIDCDEEVGGCDDGQLCGVGGPQQCGSVPACVPLTAEEACEGRCGAVSNGCGVEVDGGLIECPACPEGQACGAGGEPNVCGDASNSCEPREQAEACEDVECGVRSDGCEGSHVCGGCETGELCRGGECEALCTPVPEAEACADKECGLVSDGCSGSYSCGTCGTDEACGFVDAFQCDELPAIECVPRSAQDGCEARECGQVYDGCGTEAANTIDCSELSGGCDAGQYCGIETPFQCGLPTEVECTEASSCAELGWECGLAIDECGNVFDCADEGLSCDEETETCIGGIDDPTRCLSGIEGGPGSNCELCDSLVDCSDEPQTTTLTGRVITAGRSDTNTANQVGVPNAFVYILRNNDAAELPPIPSGIPANGTNCDRCDQQDLGPVLTSTVTNALGEFTLSENVPVGAEFLLVVKIGKFRRAVEFTVPANAACETVEVPNLSTRLPRSSSDGLGANLPHIAVSTGRVDAMECVLEKMGISAAEFSLPGANGTATPRVHMYHSNGASMRVNGEVEFTADSELYSSLTRVSSYDLVVFDCEGATEEHDNSDPNIREYVNRGGRLFASHFSSSWLRSNGSAAYDVANPYQTGLGAAATWTTSTEPASGTGIVSTARPRANAAKIQNFADWLVSEGSAQLAGTRYEFSIDEPRDLAASVGTGTEEFVYRELAAGTSVQQFSFNTPYAAPEEALCGRVTYSGFHVFAGGGGNSFASAVFPEHCSGDLSSQEKVMLYMLFDLAACVTAGGPERPVCTPIDDCTGRCGNLADGCGGVVSCACTGNDQCLAGGVCGEPECVTTTCADEGATCGAIADGCGDQLDCGDCPVGQVCGLVTANQCTITCTPSDAGEACEGKCGFVSNGCGDVHECSECPAGLSCVAGECTSQECDPRACPSSAECGIVSDGCEGFVRCGECELPEVCGGGGEANQCGHPDCPELSCDDLDAECGWIGDGCGAAVDCGPCGPGQICGQAGSPNQCFGCQPQSCEDVSAECGAIGDGCGGVVQCGTCPEGEVCGVSEPNKCGPPGRCTPLTCEDLDAECGPIGDGCGRVTDCGQCPPGELCGVQTAFQCSPPPPCEPMTCEGEDAECGALGDGCGGLLDCGACRAGESCGIAKPNQCDRLGDSR